MYELEVIKTINYGKFDNLVNVTRANEDTQGKLYIGDVIVVSTKEEADYLCGDNKNKIIACKIIREIEEAKEEKEEIKEEPRYKSHKRRNKKYVD